MVSYLGTYRDPASSIPVLVMELMEKNLTQLLQEVENSLPIQIQVDICQKVAYALAHLHSRNPVIIHRDLSSNNVLLKGTQVNVADFGLARLLDDDHSHSGTRGKGVYMPPEAYGSKPDYSDRFDVFSIGVLMLQIFTREEPNPEERQRQENGGATPFTVVPEKVRRKKQIDRIPHDHPLKAIALECLEDIKERRPSAEALVTEFRICQDQILLNKESLKDQNQKQLDIEAEVKNRLNKETAKMYESLQKQEKVIKEKDQMIKENEKKHMALIQQMEDCIYKQEQELEHLKRQQDSLQTRDRTITGLVMEQQEKHQEILAAKEEVISSQQNDIDHLRKRQGDLEAEVSRLTETQADLITKDDVLKLKEEHKQQLYKKDEQISTYKHNAQRELQRHKEG